jgi:hypothetical protein
MDPFWINREMYPPKNSHFNSLNYLLGDVQPNVALTLGLKEKKMIWYFYEKRTSSRDALSWNTTQTHFEHYKVFD